MTPFFPSFRTVVGPFIWRFGSVTNASVPGKPSGAGGGRADQLRHIELINQGRVHRDDLELLEIITIIAPCLA